MSINRLRTRLQRLERSVPVVHEPAGFHIHQAVARALCDDDQRSYKLWSEKDVTAAEKEEECRLENRIAECASTIVCPASYDVLPDEDRSTRLFYKTITPANCGGGPLTDAEIEEEIQIRARKIVFVRSPVGRGRERIRILIYQQMLSERNVEEPLSAEEKRELDQLNALYPGTRLRFLPESMIDSVVAWRQVGIKCRAEEAERSKQRQLERQKRAARAANHDVDDDGT